MFAHSFPCLEPHKTHYRVLACFCLFCLLLLMILYIVWFLFFDFVRFVVACCSVHSFVFVFICLSLLLLDFWLFLFARACCFHPPLPLPKFVAGATSLPLATTPSTAIGLVGLCEKLVFIAPSAFEGSFDRPVACN